VVVWKFVAVADRLEHEREGDERKREEREEEERVARFKIPMSHANGSSVTQSCRLLRRDSIAHKWCTTAGPSVAP
jgi:hypothetical protein